MRLSSRRRASIIVLVAIAIGAVLPSSASGQTITTSASGPVCTPLPLPEDTASAVEDFLLFAPLCAEQHVRIKVDELRDHFETATVTDREREEEITIRRSQPIVAQSGPVTIPALEPEELAALGFEVKITEERDTREVNGNRSEERTEETEVRGDDFRFKSEETRERNETDNSESFEREESQTFKSR
ncbi:MAG TPA: hypothetical protein VFA34_01410 [Actinomycetota bacterium]|jgi:hypothetical protein|nr:hypothetical protein [Actinomycetota bacterium]